MTRQQTASQRGQRLVGQDAINMALMAQDIASIKLRLDNIDVTLKSDFVRKSEFEPVRNLVYGFVVLIVVAVIGALVALVVVRPTQPVSQTISPSQQQQTK